MTTYLGSRPGWLRLLITPSTPFITRLDASESFDLTELVTLRFEAIDPLVGEVSWEAEQVDPDSVLFGVDAEDVNDMIDACGEGSRAVRLTSGNETLMAGYFEIDGEW